MTTQTSSSRPSTNTQPSDPVNHLRQEYDTWEARFNTQPPLIQRFLESQARQLAEALTQRGRAAQVRFTLPDRLVIEAKAGGDNPVTPVPAEFREQMAGGLVDRLTRSDISIALRQRLAELEQSPNRAVALSAGLLRHTTAAHMVHQLLPTGRTVRYAAVEGEEIPTLPIGDDLEPASAITQASDAIAEEGESEAGRGDLQVPYVPAARRFYLPQWVAFGDDGQLLVNTVNEAEAQIASMQRFLTILHAAVSLAPYIVADDDYQQKRYGLLGQLINQGRALARHETKEIIQAIQRRAAAQDLNRGLSLSLPYFDDQLLQMKTHSLEVIPSGRIMFVPAFVVRAARAEQAKVAQDTRLNPSTRKYLLAELAFLESAFESPAR
jgi:hypothetical protein